MQSQVTSKQLSSPEEQYMIDIAFKNITYEVTLDKIKSPNDNDRKTILHGVSGLFKAGEVTAIMGSSGAGKTSLLNIISGRIANFQGQLCANKVKYNCETFGSFANYVMQADILMETLTVRQTLMFAAEIKNIDKSEALARLNKLVNKFKLQKCLDSQVGGGIMISGISGGERKRTSIAFQLMSNPQVVALDEPTSGIDSLTAFIIVDELKQLAKQGKTIFLTIHQPNSEIFELFDKLILMVEGKIIYQGRAQYSIDYFTNNLGLKCPIRSNPADYFLSILHDMPQNRIRYADYQKVYNQTTAKTIKNEIHNRKRTAIEPQVIKKGLINTLSVLVKRQISNGIKFPIFAYLKIIEAIVVAILLGGVYFNAGRKDYTQATYWYTIVGLFFYMSMDLFIQSSGFIAIVLPIQRVLLFKEENSKLYSLFEFFLMRLVIQIPFNIIVPLLYSLVCYWMIGLSSTAEQFFTLYFIVALLYFTGSSFGMMTGSILNEGKQVGTFVPIILFPLMLVSGYFKNIANMPLWYGWVQYISPFKYGFSSLLQNETKYKSSMINNLNFDAKLWPSMGLLFAVGVGFRVIAFIILWFKKGKID